ncbi:MAG: hypothetical protein ABUR63_02305 [Verrucomicrobiota bacterium]
MILRRFRIAVVLGVALAGCSNNPPAATGSGGSSSASGGSPATGGSSPGAGGSSSAGAGGSSSAGAGGTHAGAGGSAGRDGGMPRDAAGHDAGLDAHVPSDGGVATRPPQTCVPPAAYNQPVTQLSATGCVDPKNPTHPAASLVPYEVNSPLWSDGAAKQRFMAIPDGAVIKVKDCARDPASCQPLANGGTSPPEGHWELPVGSVLMKNFLFGGKLIETRLFVRFDDMWIGYSYRWDAQQTDATIVPQAGLTANIVTGDGGAQSWYFPGRNDCLQCHNSVFGDSLGTETRQLNRQITAANGVVTNQLDTFEHLGMVAAPIPRLAPLPDTTLTASTDSVEARARSYLHGNCAICHLPGGSYSSIDMRFGTPLAMMNICNVAPNKGDLGVTGSKRLTPGAPQKSVMLLRMQAPAGMDNSRMPPLASSVLDSNGINLVSQWIKGTTTCP